MQCIFISLFKAQALLLLAPFIYQGVGKFDFVPRRLTSISNSLVGVLTSGRNSRLTRPVSIFYCPSSLVTISEALFS